FLKAVEPKKAGAHDEQSFLKQPDPPPAASAAATPPAAAAAAADGSGTPAAGTAPAAATADGAAAAGSPAPDPVPAAPARLTRPGENASQAQIAAWMGALAEQRGLPRELPIMASLTESGMKNLNFGDRDSVGFFQMRVGTWNQGDYAGFPDKPELQVKWFLDNAEQVKKARVAAGQSIDDPNQFGNWIADVERPAEQYRGRYQLRLDEANGLREAAPPPSAAPVAAAAVEQGAAPAGGGGGGSPLGAAALQVAQSQKGGRGIGGANVGPPGDQYPAAAKGGARNPWC